VALETELAPRELLDTLLAIERELGRERRERWGPRTIDLDLLLYGDETIDEPGLTVPHPRLHERRFALEPLLDLDPELAIPGRGRVTDVLAGLH
jgi:2-amino-4-hydroxy-6-hydroxymethyldihydropteridine diphosphokinase